MLVIVSMTQTALGATASELFADGNRLFRDDLYWAALLRYGEAAEAGMNTPLLHYNTGVAHYKARQYDRASESLKKAATYGPLAAIAHYNIGLSEYRLGNTEQALSWLRRAANQDERKDIARLARTAIRQVESELVEDSPVMQRAVVIQEKQKIGNFDFRLRSGIGFDDNVFRSPEKPYVDRADPNRPLVVPVVQSGPYLPVNLSARYQVNALDNEGFFGSYMFNGRFYNDETLNNADEHLQELAFGSEYRRREEGDETHVFSAFTIAEHNQSYYDPDNGLYRTVDGVDISERMSYLRYGPEFWVRRKLGRYSFGFRAVGQLWNYEDVVVVPEYDHEYWLLGLSSDIRLSSSSLLRINAEYYTRRYGERPSFELDGTQPVGNTPVRYDYLVLGLEARQRITSWMWFGIGYTRADRQDRHVGYNSYVRSDYAVNLNMQFGERLKLDVAGRYFLYDYENAFAFHDPTAGRKTMDRIMGTVRATFRMTRTLDLVGEYRYRDAASNDTRLAYNRSQSTLTVRWMP